MNLETLVTIGWNSKRETAFKQLGLEDVCPGRIVADHGQKYRIITERGEGWAEMSGRLLHELEEHSAHPAVGDWVALRLLTSDSQDGVIHGVLPRSSQISRRAAGSIPVEQIVAANVDLLFIVVALNLDFNLRRLERYLIMAWNSGALPVILLSKADLCDDPQRYISEVEEVSPGVQVLAISAMEDRGAEELHHLLKPGVTVALTGSSGSGKSTIVNWMAGQEMQRTQDIRESDSRGRHTTTHREMFILPQGAVMIDTPGMRELQLWDDEGGLAEAFSDISELAQRCRFGDCRHERELGCAVRTALEEGTLDPKRMDNYRRTQRELKFQNAKERRRGKPGKASSDKKDAPRGKGEQRRQFEVVEWE